MNMMVSDLLVFMIISVNCAAADFGLRQSPIDVVTENLAVALLPSLQWGNGYFQLADTLHVECDGNSVIVTTNQSDVPTLSGGPLGSAVYKLNSIHFHWGLGTDGSEHTINGRPYSMEMQIVHTKGNLTMAEARRIPDGISIIAYMINVTSTDIKNNRNVEAFRILANTVEHLREFNKKVEIEEKFPLRNLVAPFFSDYATYAGSLTTSPHSEGVIWILSPYELVINARDINSFRHINVENNYRYTKPLHSRTVYYDISQSNDNLNQIKKKYYNDTFAKPNGNNIFRKSLSEDYKYQVSKSLFSKPPKMYLDDNNAYYFDTKINLNGDEQMKYYAVVVVNFRNKRYAIYYKKMELLTYGFNIMGLIGLGHIPILKQQDTVTELLADLNHAFLIYDMNVANEPDNERNLIDQVDLYRIKNSIDTFCWPYLDVTPKVKKGILTL